MEFYSTLETILRASTSKQKIELFHIFYDAYKRGKITKEETSSIAVFQQPSYASFCTVIDPKETMRRAKLGGVRGQIQLVHSIAHIEYSAIDLALDAAYRFRELGEEFDQDWLKVADDEIRHFGMLEDLLGELGSFYSEYPVHNGLFEASVKTTTFLDRMAVVPRYFEASGLDATPLIIAKLKTIKGDLMAQKIIQVLEIILEEEVDHVLRGDRWFKVACDNANVTPEVYFDIIEQYYPNVFPKKVSINVDARIAAGFTKEELKRIG